MAIEDRRATVIDGVRVHYLDTDPSGGAPGVPLLYVHGAIGTAEDFLPHIERHAPRRCLALSMRGMGKSDTPATGYGFVDKVADIEAVFAAASLESAVLFGFSAGVPCVIEFAIRHPGLVRGLLLGDYAPRYLPLGDHWLAATSGIPEERARTAARVAMSRQSADVDLSPRLGEIHCPTLVIRGGGHGGMLSEEAAERYEQLVPGCFLVELPRAGHVLWEPDINRFIFCVEDFLKDVDQGVGL